MKIDEPRDHDLSADIEDLSRAVAGNAPLDGGNLPVPECNVDSIIHA
jgi:hypothetical protein